MTVGQVRPFMLTGATVRIGEAEHAKVNVRVDRDGRLSLTKPGTTFPELTVAGWHRINQRTWQLVTSGGDITVIRRACSCGQ